MSVGMMVLGLGVTIAGLVMCDRVIKASPKVKDFEAEIAKKAGCDNAVIEKVKKGGNFSQEEKAKINTSPEAREFVEDYLKSKGGDKHGAFSSGFGQDGHLKPEEDLVAAYEMHVRYAIMTFSQDF